MSEVKRWIKTQIPSCSYNAPEYVLASDYDAIKAENERLREALWEYGRHERKCVIKMANRGGECTCGLDAALSPQETTK